MNQEQADGNPLLNMTTKMTKQKEEYKNPPGPKVSYHAFSAETNPVITEQGSGKWVKYGAEDQYPQLLIQKYQKSAVHNSLVTGISMFIAGEEITGLDDPSKVNSLGDTFHETFAKCGFDLKLHGYYCLQVVYSMDGKNIVERLHVPAEKVRSGPADQHGRIHNYYIHPNFIDTTGKNQPKKIAAFNPQEGMKDKRQLQFVKLPSAPGQFYYRAPDYIGALNYISLDDSISEFHLDNIETGFFPSAIVQFFNGEPTEDEQRSIEAAFKNKFAGARGKKLVFVYNKNKNQSVEFTTFEPADLDERFKNLGPQVTEKIMIAHRVTSPMLFGVKTDSGLGNNADEMKVGLLIMNKLVIVPYQKVLLSGFRKTFIGDQENQVIEVQTLQPEEFLTIGNTGETSSDTEEEIQDANVIKSESMSSVSDRESLPMDVTPEMEKDILEGLDQVGQKKKDFEKNFDLIEVPDEIADEDVEQYLKAKYQFAVQSDPDASSRLDKGLFKIRYEYNGPQDDANRTFCAEVLAKDLIYRREDINQMSFTQSNPEFGTYSIFKYKGSYGCRHRWKRLIYFRKRNTSGQFLPNAGLENDVLVPNSSEAQVPTGALESDATTVNPKPSR